MPSCRMSRLVAVQRWPVVPNAPQSTPSSARSRSASSSTIMRVLAAHLERQPLVHAAARLADDAPRLRRSGERDDRNERMVHDRRARRFAVAVHELDHLGRQPGLEQDLDEHVPVCGTSSAGLKTHAFPHSSAGNIFHVGIAIGKLNGVMMPATPIGRRKLIAHLFAQLARHGVAEQPAPFGRRVVRGVDPFLHVAARLGERLAHLARHQVGDLFLPLRQEVADAAQHVAARGRRRARARARSRAARTPPRARRPPRRRAESVPIDVATRRPDSCSRNTRRRSAATHSPPMKFLNVFMSLVES